MKPSVKPAAHHRVELLPRCRGLRKPAFAVEGGAAQGSFGGVVGQADASVGQKPGEGSPVVLLEQAVGGFGERVVFGQPDPFEAQPSLKVGQEQGRQTERASRRAMRSKPLMSRSMSKVASIRLTDSIATGEI